MAGDAAVAEFGCLDIEVHVAGAIHEPQGARAKDEDLGSREKKIRNGKTMEDIACVWKQSNVTNKMNNVVAKL